jgi:hydrogenase nickel incorporation protein HypB
MFRVADLMAVTKTDLLQAVGDFDPARAKRHLRELASVAPVVELSARNGEGMDAWIDWLIGERAIRRPQHAGHAEHVHA